MIIYFVIIVLKKNTIFSSEMIKSKIFIREKKKYFLANIQHTYIYTQVKVFRIYVYKYFLNDIQNSIRVEKRSFSKHFFFFWLEL